MMQAPDTLQTHPQIDGRQSRKKAERLIFLTALDTTWRVFVPTLGGTFLGIGLDALFGVAPIATFLCLVLGVIMSMILITRQLRAVRRPLQK